MSKLSFKMKIMLMIGTALAALLIMAIMFLLQERRLISESRKDLLTTAVQSAHSIVAAYQAKAASGAMPQEEAQKAKEEAQKAQEQAKKWADKRVATVGNQITLEKSKNAELEKEVEGKDKKLDDQATVIQWYQKKFGKAPDNLPKL